VLCHPNLNEVNEEKLVVLLVDDSALIMEKMIGMLQEIENIRIVFQANCYDEAIGIIREAEPDIVLMDIFLGDKIGFDLLNFLKIKYPTIEIVILTNHAGLPYREVCEKIGAHHFLDKSNDFELISKIINDRHSNNNDNQTKRTIQSWGNSKR
jgi:two-component system OmpR family response regulator